MAHQRQRKTAKYATRRRSSAPAALPDSSTAVWIGDGNSFERFTTTGITRSLAFNHMSNAFTAWQTDHQSIQVSNEPNHGRTRSDYQEMPLDLHGIGGQFSATSGSYMYPEEAILGHEENEADFLPLHRPAMALWQENDSNGMLTQENFTNPAPLENGSTAMLMESDNVDPYSGDEGSTDGTSSFLCCRRTAKRVNPASGSHADEEDAPPSDVFNQGSNNASRSRNHGRYHERKDSLVCACCVQ